ncbi:hypothetical protein HUT18_15020 [Streptomyces sp. NA04227]|uniref:hypothetical protein n=1 Tax=Streptomyces sp. NA04227 TaxID=2742136 RepID=UPI001590004E|nr:hypothetical protein [Streptomyces sp. NA04227]QKW07500.1 hypothetical protein HUT18_15020 [Streptomyces sp. NA04227]
MRLRSRPIPRRRAARAGLLAAATITVLGTLATLSPPADALPSADLNERWSRQ